jgi:hypothetical protein
MSTTAAISLGLALLALFVSFYSLLAGRARDRRDVFLEMHRLLAVDKDLQEGRRLVYERINSVDDVRSLRDSQDPDDRAAVASINNALGMFELLALYVHRGYIDEDLVLREWGHTYAKAWSHGRHFVQERLDREKGGWSGWPHLRTLGPDAEQWAAATSQQTLLEQAEVEAEARRKHRWPARAPRLIDKQ